MSVWLLYTAGHVFVTSVVNVVWSAVTLHLVGRFCDAAEPVTLTTGAAGEGTALLKPPPAHALAPSAPPAYAAEDPSVGASSFSGGGGGGGTGTAFCTACGTRSPPGARFCVSCGSVRG